MSVATRVPRPTAAAEPVARPAPPAARPRIGSLDFVRGVAMVLMAIDHVRVYSGLPAGGPTAGIFFTRWVTHFVAPAFVFLAGTSAYLHGRKLGSTSQLSRFLLTRGAWLVLLELTIIRIAWTFNLDFANYMLAGVIWMIGCCMMLMAAVVYLPIVAVGGIGIAIIALHNVTDMFAGPIGKAFGENGPGAAPQDSVFRRRRAADAVRSAAARALRHRSVDWRDDGRLRVRCGHGHAARPPPRLLPASRARAHGGLHRSSRHQRIRRPSAVEGEPDARCRSPSSTPRSIRRRSRSC